MLLNYAKIIAEKHCEVDAFNDVMLSLPVFFNKNEVHAVENSIRMSDFKFWNQKPRQWMPSSSSIALNYGISKKEEIFKKSNYILFYDMGALQTTVSIVEYKPRTWNDTINTTPGKYLSKSFHTVHKLKLHFFEQHFTFKVGSFADVFALNRFRNCWGRI